MDQDRVLACTLMYTKFSEDCKSLDTLTNVQGHKFALMRQSFDWQETGTSPNRSSSIIRAGDQKVAHATLIPQGCDNVVVGGYGIDAFLLTNVPDLKKK